MKFYKTPDLKIVLCLNLSLNITSKWWNGILYRNYAFLTIAKLNFNDWAIIGKDFKAH